MYSLLQKQQTYLSFILKLNLTFILTKFKTKISFSKKKTLTKNRNTTKNLIEYNR